MNLKTMSLQELATLLANREHDWQEAWVELMINRCGSMIKSIASHSFNELKSTQRYLVLKNSGLENPDDIFAALLKDYAGGNFGAFEKLDVIKGLIQSALNGEKNEGEKQKAENYEVVHPEGSRITPEIAEILIKKYIGASVWGYCRNRLRQLKKEHKRALNTVAIVEEKSDDSDNREIAVPDFLSCTDEHIINKITFGQVFRKLPERAQKVVSSYYEEDLTQTEIAEQLGFRDHSSISRILTDFRRELERAGFNH